MDTRVVRYVEERGSINDLHERINEYIVDLDKPDEVVALIREHVAVYFPPVPA